MSSEGKDPGEKVPGEQGPVHEEKQHVSGLGRDHSVKPPTDEVIK
jgi:membrane protein